MADLWDSTMRKDVGVSMKWDNISRLLALFCCFVCNDILHTLPRLCLPVVSDFLEAPCASPTRG